MPGDVRRAVATVPELLAEGAGCSAGGPALLCRGMAPLRHAELGELIAATTATLRAAGVRRDSRVAICTPASAATATCSLALMAASTCVPLNPKASLDELLALLPRLGVTHVVLPADRLEPRLADASETASASSTTALPITQACETLGLTALDLRPSTRRAGDFELELPASATLQHAAPALHEAEARPDDIALVLPTSGSTSAAKLVPISHRNLVASSEALARSLQLSAADRCLSALPMFHIGALVDLLIGPLSVGGSVAVSESMSAAACLAAMQEQSATWFQGVPTMLHDLLQHLEQTHTETAETAETPVLRLRFVRSVSAALPTPTREGLEARLGRPVIEIYGMTETSGVIASNPLPPAERRAGSVGTCVGATVHILGPEGQPRAAGEDGEIFVEGPAVTTGYEAGEATPRSAQGWLATGDIGHLDADGYLFLTGRIKEIINRGGEKIAPLEIDAVAATHPAVASAASFGVPHPSLGEEVAIAVVPRAGHVLDPTQLRSHIARSLSEHKVPRRVITLERLPTTASGKLQRRALSEIAATQAEGPKGKGGVSSARVQLRGTSAVALAQIWQEVLGLEDSGDVEPLTAQDDFFDRGGDSLKAANMLRILRETKGIHLEGATLFDHPTLGSLARYLDEGDHGPALLPEVETCLPADLYRAVHDVVSTWPGQRTSPTALLVGFNTEGRRPPLFWCCQSRREATTLAKALGRNQPLWAMRSLHGMPERSDEALAMLVRHYVEEIQTHHPGKRCSVGGNCLGGQIAFHIARELRRDERKVTTLFLRDHFEPQPYDGTVFIICANPSPYSPLHGYLQPRKGWRRYYSGKLLMEKTQTSHARYWATKAGRAATYAIIRRRLRKPATGPKPIKARPYGVEPLTQEERLAAVECRLPAVVFSGGTTRLRVRITNLSERTWKPTKASGIFLSSRWIGEETTLLKSRAGHCTFEEAIAPGQSVQRELTLKVPNLPGHWEVEVGMVDDGVRWFAQHGSGSVKRRVRILPRPHQFRATFKRWKNGEMVRA